MARVIAACAKYLSGAVSGLIIGMDAANRTDCSG